MFSVFPLLDYDLTKKEMRFVSDSIELNYASFQHAVYPYCSDLSGIREYVEKTIGPLDDMSQDFLTSTYYWLLASTPTM